jgi:hypothetical protein
MSGTGTKTVQKIAIVGEAVYQKDKLFWDNTLYEENGCLIPTTKHCYGIGYRLTRRNGRDYCSHRLAYELYYGTFDYSLQVCHKCDNPPCVNPHHLFIGTQSDNFQDKVLKGRDASQKLNVEKVKEIRARYSQGGCTTRSLAKDYHVNNSTIWQIVSGKAWWYV